MDIIKYRAFFTVSTLGSFSRAAETLFFTQPAISAQIKELENEYGTELFYRVGRNISLTPAGEALLPFVESLLQTYENSRFAVELLRDTKEGNIRLGVSKLPGVSLVPGYIQEYKVQYPNVTFSISSGYSSEIRELVEKSQLDLGIIGRSQGVDDSTKTNAHLLARDEIVLVTSKAHPFSEKKYVEVSDLTNLRLIVSLRNTVTRQAIDRLFHRYQIPFLVEYEIENKEMIKAMVEKNLGVAFFCSMDVSREVKLGTVSAIKIKDERLHRDVVVIHHKDRKFSPSVQSFLDYLTAQSKSE